MKNFKMKKGYVIIDALMATIILALIGGAVSIGCVTYANVSSQTAHRLEAIDICRSVVEQVRDKGDTMALGTYDKSSDSAVCTLPDSYFADKLKGKVVYEVTDKIAKDTVKMRMATVTVTWTEAVKPFAEKKEILITGLYFYG